MIVLTRRPAGRPRAPSAVLAGEKLRKADRIPAAPTAEQKAPIAEGIALHDAGQYDGAIDKFKQVLEDSPDEVHAMYELGFTYFSKKDYESALAIARRGKVGYRISNGLMVARNS